MASPSSLFAVLILCTAAFVSAQPTPSATPYFLAQGGGPLNKGAKVRGAPPASLATPAPAGVGDLFAGLPGPVAALITSAVQTLQANGNFTVLLDLLTNYIDVTALLGELTPPATLFAPTDAAFSVLPPTVIEGLKENPAVLQDLLLYHFIHGYFPAAVLLSAPTGTVTSLFKNQTINITATNGAVFVGVGQPLAKVTNPDVVLVPDRFVIHGISMVLTPSRFVIYATKSAPAGNATTVSSVPLPIKSGPGVGEPVPTAPANGTLPIAPRNGTLPLAPTNGTLP